jgi:hypothetical protein
MFAFKKIGVRQSSMMSMKHTSNPYPTLGFTANLNYFARNSFKPNRVLDRIKAY